MKKSIIALSFAGALLGGAVAFAAEQAPAKGGGGGGNTQADYHPSFADMMTMAVQPRHTKLYYAGQQKNWVYANYEANELRGALNRIARTIPMYQNADLATTINSMIGTQLIAVSDAVKAQDQAQFFKAYGDLTTACNTCHAAVNHAYVVIKAPAAAMYPDQEFAPQ